MEVQPMVFPGKEGKSQPVKSRYNRKSIAGPKPNAKEQPFVQRRVFGVARNSNIQEKTEPEKPKWQRPSVKPVLTTPPKEPAKKVTSNQKPLPNKLVQNTPAPEEPPKTTQPVRSTPPVQTIPPAPEEPPKTAQLLNTGPLAPDKPSKTVKPVKIPPPARDDPPKTAQPAVSAPPAPVEPTKTTQPVETAPLAPELAPEEPPKTAQPLETDTPAAEKPTKTAKPVETDPLELPKTDKPVQTTPPAPEEQPKPARTDKPRKKKSVTFIEGKDAGPASEVGIRTPRPTRAKLRVSGTPYHTAERCSKCRFDRMETASYWLAQVKLAEAVGKHFVSAGLFKLALESKAEPNRSLRGEVKRYLSRNMYLSGEPEWRDVTASYGLNIAPHDQVEVKALDEARDHSTEQITEQLENNLND